MKYFSMFSGIGGFEGGFPSSWNCAGYSETDKFALQIYRRHFNHEALGDATRIDTSTIPDFDLLCGGFPCQSFSVAGKHKGLADSRGTLFFEIARILNDKRPRYFLLENVKGLLGHDNGKTFQTMVRILTDIGYLVQWEVLNSKHFGVPQNRERLFIIGHFRTESRPEIFPLQNSKKSVTGYGDTKRMTLIFDLPRGFKKGGVSKRQVMRTISQSSFQYNTMIIQTRDKYSGSYIIHTNKSGSMTKHTKTTCALRSTASYNYQIVDGIRRLTPIECERLQGFPDDYTAWGIDENGESVQISDTQRYKCLGNAVTVNVIYAITKRFAEAQNL